VKSTGRKERGRKWSDKDGRGQEQERDKGRQIRCEEDRKRRGWRRQEEERDEEDGKIRSGHLGQEEKGDEDSLQGV
jgi:hypothetical protein